MKNGLLLSVFLLSGCTTMLPEKPVEGWPKDIEIRLHEGAGLYTVQSECWGSLPWYWKAAGSFAWQCATVNLPMRTCDIYTVMGKASEHEYGHCRGMDHDGLLQDYFDRWAAVIDKEIEANPKLTNPIPPETFKKWKEKQR